MIITRDMFTLMERIAVIHKHVTENDMEEVYGSPLNLMLDFIRDHQYSAQTWYALEKRGFVEGVISEPCRWSWEKGDLKDGNKKKDRLFSTDVALTFTGLTAYNLTKDKFHRFQNLTKVKI
ncbi:hypothetical protein ACFL3R_00765 [Thermodesulfobacteriota bacterium]